MKKMTREKVTQALFGAAVLAIVREIAFGPEMSLRTGVLLFALALVPPAIVLRLWPAAPALATS